MKTIYLVRHGQTNSNAESLVQHASSQLSEKGLRQADTLAERLRHLSFSNLLVSDYVRTRQTVAPLLPHISVEPVYTALLRETKRPTQYIGAHQESVEYHTYLDAADAHITDPAWHLEDEENFHDVVARVQQFFAHIDTLEGDTVAVSHGRYIIYIMMYVIMGGNLTPAVWLEAMHHFKTKNTGITVLQYDEKYQHWLLRTFNDHAHFAE